MSGKRKPLSEVIFNKYDSDCSSSIDITELRNCCYDLGHYLSDEELSVAIHKLDANGDGTVQYNEFLAWWREKNRFAMLTLQEGTKDTLSDCIKYFKYFDKNMDGNVTIDEFIDLHADLIKNGYGSYLTEPQADLEKLDKDKSGGISLNEYVSWLVSIGAISITKD